MTQKVLVFLVGSILFAGQMCSLGDDYSSYGDIDINRYDVRSDTLRDMFLLFTQVKDKRAKAVSLKNKSMDNKSRIEGLENEYKAARQRFDELNIALSLIQHGDAIANNKIVAELNLTQSKLMNIREQIDDVRSGSKDARSDYSLAQDDYEKSLFSLAKQFGAFDTDENRSKYTNDEEYICRKMAESLKDMKNDFSKSAVDVRTTENGIMVDAVINENLSVRLLVDTGASIVLLRKNIAERLGLDLNNVDHKVECTLADGSKSIATPVMLNTVEVNGFKAKNVAAAVSDGAVGADIDGLLGMSYLGNFVFRVDANSNRLIIEEFTPGKE